MWHPQALNEPWPAKVDGIREQALSFVRLETRP
jgi:hypothetical protein